MWILQHKKDACTESVSFKDEKIQSRRMGESYNINRICINYFRQVKE